MVVLIITCGVMALTLPLYSRARVALKRSACLTNERQIGMALLMYASENNGILPPTTHSTGRMHIGESWIYQIQDYIGNFDKTRICPAEPATRREKILKMKATSYVLNELVTDEEPYNNLRRIPRPAETLLLFVMSENRNPSQTWDHAHTSEWYSWQNALSDVEVDRHREGDRASDRMTGSSNYLYADGHVENLSAREFQAKFENGVNPAAVPGAP